VIDQARIYFLKPPVDERVGADDHPVIAAAEQIDDFLQRVAAAVQVVGVELNGVAPAVRGKDRLVPASADVQIKARRDEMDHPGILSRHSREERCGAVGGMIVHDDDVEGKIGLLRQGARDGSGHRPPPVAHGNNDAGLCRKTAPGGRHLLKAGRSQAPIRLRCCVAAFSMARWTDRLRGSW